MVVETKYNIGDEVWFQTLGIIYKANVIEIVINILIDGNVVVNYKLGRRGYYYERNEDELIQTKDELLRGL